MITNIQAAPATGDVSLTWNSQPGAVYAIFGTQDLKAPAELDDSVDSQGTTTTASFNNPDMKDKARYFFTFRETERTSLMPRIA